MRFARTIAIVVAASSTSCATLQSPLLPAGPQAGHIVHVWNVFLAVSAVVWCSVMAVLAVAVIRRRRRAGESRSAIIEPDESSQRRTTTVVAASSVVTVLVLFGMLVVSIAAGHAIASAPTEDALEIQVVGHQWWWEVQYPSSSVSAAVSTANEIHIPVGRPVRLLLESRDVIHSFWVPALAGKRDMIPGHTTHLVLRADQPGRYRGQCAEFCGLQHAHMAIWVIAESPREFAAWLSAQRASAREPVTPEEHHGQALFLSRTCAMCHAVQGTVAGSAVGPDLTHFGSRSTIAGGILPNTRDELARWIVDPQAIKPGANMPQHVLAARDVSDLVTYLESLR